jgi:hypothetical protein
MIRWRGAVQAAIRGQRGQRFFRDLVAALDAMPEKELISGELELQGQHCALGALGAQRGLPLKELEKKEIEDVAPAFDIAVALAREVVYENDEGGWFAEAPRERWKRMRRWAAYQLVTITQE